jgi:HEAT repeat protein
VRYEIVENIISSQQDQKNLISFLIDGLKDPSKEIRLSVIKALGKNPSLDVLNPLLDLLQYGNKELEKDIILVLIKLGEMGFSQNIIKQANGKNVYVKKTLAFIFGILEAEESLPLLRKFLDDDNLEVKKNALIALSKIVKISDDEIIQKVEDLLEFNDKELKITIINFLKRIDSQKTTSILLKLLRDESKEVRKEARTILINRFKKSPSFSNIYKVIKSRNTNARIECIKILGSLSDKNGLDLLIKSLNSRNAKIRRTAYKSILKVVKNELDEKLIDALSSSSANIRKWVAKILSKIKDPSAINLLFNLLKDPKSKVRYAAMRSLTKFKDSLVIETSKHYVNDDDWKFRRALVKLFRRMETNKANDILLRFLEDEDKYTKIWATKALGEKKVEKSIPQLQSLLNEEDPKIILAAIESLGIIGKRESIKSLTPLIGHQNWEIKNQVEKTLDRIDPNWFDSI